MLTKHEKYVRQQAKGLTYQRDYPKDVKELCGKKTFTFSIGKADSAPAEVRRSVTKAEDAFALTCKRIRNTDPAAFNTTELDKAATYLLRSRKLQIGAFTTNAKVGVDVLLSQEEKRKGEQLQAYPTDYALWAIPEMEDVIDAYNEGKSLTFEHKVIKHAYDKLIDKAKAKPQSLQLLWEEYLIGRQLDIKSREGKRIQHRWDAWLACTGDIVVSREAIEQIHDGLDAYVEERKAAGIKGQSISRELREPIACLRYANKVHRFGWVITPPHIMVEKAKTKDVLKQDEQRTLVNYCLASTAPEQKRTAALVLIILQCGGMASEVKRLTLDKVGLDATTHHIVIAGKTKTTARPRIVPIVLGRDLIKEMMNPLLDWLRNTTESTHSKKISSFMTAAIGEDKFTAHCLRHTFTANAHANGADFLAVAKIGGWSGARIGTSNVMLGYGAEGLAQSEVLKGLQRESLKIHKHLLGSSGQVIAFPARA